jgi:hypothetical protein
MSSYASSWSASVSARSRLAGCALAALAGGLAVPIAARAQSQSVLSFLPTADRRLEMGATATGALSASDHLSADDAFLEAWSFEASPGQSVTIDLESDDFDAVLYVVGPGLTETLHDDDGGGGCNSRLGFTVLESGPFHVVASSLGARETGTYTLRVSDRAGETTGHACGQADPSRLQALSTEGRTISMGGRGTGQLGPFSDPVQDGRPGEAWSLEGSAGDRVSIVMEASAFDAYLYLLGPGLDEVLTDDDGGGELNARLDATLPSDGPYRVVASSISSEANGSYSIRVEEPVDLGALPTDGRSIEPGQTSGGVLTFGDPIVVDGRRGQPWALEASAGQTVTIDLMSDELDSYLYLVGPGLDEPLSDDDGGGELNSRITHTFTESGTYRVIVSALSSDATGAFTLQVTAR